jgi:hypothetical protein
LSETMNCLLKEPKTEDGVRPHAPFPL